MTGSNRQRGQVLLPGAILLAFFFGGLSIYVIDTRLVESGYEQLADTLQLAAEDGTAGIDLAALRVSDGRTLVLDHRAAAAIVNRSLGASRMPGLRWSVSVGADTVTVSATARVQLFVLGAVDLKQTRSARLARGQ